MILEPTEDKTKNRKRLAPIQWQDVFHMLSQTYHPNTFYFEDVLTAVEKVGLSIQNESLRVKLAKYTAKGFLKKVGRKEYLISQKGQVFFNLITRS